MVSAAACRRLRRARRWARCWRGSSMDSRESPAFRSLSMRCCSLSRRSDGAPSLVSTRLARAAREERASGHDLEDRTAPPSVSAGLLGIVRYRELLRNLVLRDVKLKYRGSVFGFFWSLANPLLMVVTYTIAFTLHPAGADRRLRVQSAAGSAELDVLSRARR